MDKPINNFMPWPHWQHFWSLDGMPSQYNQLPRGQVQNYTCTISVYLSEAPVPMNGIGVPLLMSFVHCVCVFLVQETTSCIQAATWS